MKMVAIRRLLAWTLCLVTLSIYFDVYEPELMRNMNNPLILNPAAAEYIYGEAQKNTKQAGF